MSVIEQSANPNIVICAGGGGGSVMGKGFVEAFPDANITVVVPTGDGGSKTGELRELYGGPAVGDMRKVLGAVAGNGCGNYFEYRFSGEDGPEDVANLGKGMVEILENAGQDTLHAQRVMDEVAALSDELPNGLRGHTFGNLVLTVLRLERDDDLEFAAQVAGDWLQARATVLPVSAEAHDLVMQLPNGQEIRGEGIIDDLAVDPRGAQLRLESVVPGFTGRVPTISRGAFEAIVNSDVLLVGPGSPFTSASQILGANGTARAIDMQREKGGTFVAPANLVVEDSTPGLTLEHYLKILEEGAQRPPDVVVYNNAHDGLPAGKVPLDFSHAEGIAGQDALLIADNLVRAEVLRRDPNDPISHLRSAAHHDPWVVAKVLAQHNIVPLKPVEPTLVNA